MDSIEKYNLAMLRFWQLMYNNDVKEYGLKHKETKESYNMRKVYLFSLFHNSENQTKD